jgi:uncharacterized protein (DUF1499 family)
VLRRLLPTLAAAVLAAAAALSLAIRLAPDDPARWHVDPATAPGTGHPNANRVLPEAAAGPADSRAPVYAVPAAELAAAFDRMAQDQPRTARLAGGPDSLHATYVQRSRVWGFPDYVSVRFYELPGGRSTLALWSRARYGRGDLGVNAARARAWLAALEPLQAG